MWCQVAANLADVRSMVSRSGMAARMRIIHMLTSLLRSTLSVRSSP